MAPELHTGGQAGVESDIYSLGCLLWAAITGAAPYAGTSDYQIVSAHLAQPVPQLQPGPPAADAVNQVLLRALAKSPADRYSDAAELSRDVRAAASLAERSPRAGPAGDARPGRPARRRRGRVGLVAAALVLLLASGIGAAVALVTAGDDSADPAPQPSSPAVVLVVHVDRPRRRRPRSTSARAIASLTDALVGPGA